MKIPSITSTLASEALQATPDLEIKIGQTAEDFAGHIVYLLQHPDKATKMAEKAYDFVHKHYNWDAATQKLENLIVNT